MLGAAATVVARASSARRRNILGVSEAAAADAGEVSPNTLLKMERVYALQGSRTFVYSNGALACSSQQHPRKYA